MNKLERIKKFYKNKDPNIVALVNEVIQLRDRAISYICAKCGRFVYIQLDSLDSGTTFTCDKCSNKTVVMLFEMNAYVKWSRQQLKEAKTRQQLKEVKK